MGYISKMGRSIKIGYTANIKLSNYKKWVTFEKISHAVKKVGQIWKSHVLKIVSHLGLRNTLQNMSHSVKNRSHCEKSVTP